MKSYSLKNARLANAFASSIKSSSSKLISAPTTKCVLAGVLLLLVAARFANASPVVIDDFSSPAAAQAYVVGLINPDPYVLKQAGGIGGERDLLVDVDGAAGAIAAVGTVGGGSYLFGTTGTKPTTATLEYDGIDLGDTVGSPGSLNNAQLLNVDLTGGGSNDRIRFDFDSVDSAGALNLGVSLTITSSAGTATWSGNVPKSAGPSSTDVLFSQFVGSLNPALVTSITAVFNTAKVNDADFQLNSITAVPEPSTWVLLASGSLAALAVARRRRAA